jgi:putative membrane protein
MMYRLVFIGLTIVATAFSFWGAPYLAELFLQHIPTLLGLTVLVIAVTRFQPLTLSFFCCLTFLWLHIIGARWLYSYVPYDEVFRGLTGYTLSEIFGWERNHYDRLVHFAFGILGMPPLSELLQKYVALRPAVTAAMAMVFVLAISAAYEILEWQVAMVFAPEFAESYNGQQGDIWDAQKDMALAWLGAALMIPFIYRWLTVKPWLVKTFAK